MIKNLQLGKLYKFRYNGDFVVITEIIEAPRRIKYRSLRVPTRESIGEYYKIIDQLLEVDSDGNVHFDYGIAYIKDNGELDYVSHRKLMEIERGNQTR